MRKTAVVLVLSLFLGLLSACGVTPGVSEETAVTTTAAVTSAPAETTAAPPLAERKGNSGTNIRNSGHVAYADGWVYISEPRYGHRLDRMREDGSGRVTLREGACENINVLDGWVYYNVPDWGGKSGIYRMKTDGSENNILLEDAWVNRMLVADDWIYFSRYGGRGGDLICRLSIDGEQLEAYNIGTRDHGHLSDVSNGWIYYTSADDGEWSLFRIRIDGQGQPEHLSAITSPRFSMVTYAIADDWVYYVSMDGTQLEKSRMNGEDHSVIFKFEYQPSDVEAIHIIDDWIYMNYRLSARNFELVKMRLDGSGQIRTDVTLFWSFNIAGNWIYYMSDGGYVFNRIGLDGTGEERFWDESVDEWPELH